jgi:hydroxymethylglutaryl-CoA lyase
MGLLANLPAEARVYEVGPRDGLQNEAVSVGTVRKARLVEALAYAGLKRIEITSFVSPKWIPQLADADELARLVTVPGPFPDATYSALVPNLRGLERADQAGLREVAVFLSASETHNRRNINKPIGETLAEFRDLVPEAARRGMRVRGYISTVWGCPYEGDVPVARSIGLATSLIELGCFEISLGDTIGVGSPLQTRNLLADFLVDVPVDTLALHLHDTRGLALTNALVALDKGIRTFDAAIAGLGWCPYAPGASGNLATEDLVYMLHGLGVETGIDMEKLWEAGQVAEAIVYRDLPGRVHRAGLRSLRR